MKFNLGFLKSGISRTIYVDGTPYNLDDGPAEITASGTYSVSFGGGVECEVELWGGGTNGTGGGSQSHTINLGGASTFDGMTAGGGRLKSPVSTGVGNRGGLASGGDINTNGNNGGNGENGSDPTPAGGFGAGAPNGGGNRAGPNGGAYNQGGPGTAPGGGGAGGSSVTTGSGGGGGGSGAYCKRNTKTFTGTMTLVVGIGGAAIGSNGGGAGAAGKAIFA